jgi:hypothetical protein
MKPVSGTEYTNRESDSKNELEYYYDLPAVMYGILLPWVID